MKSKAAHVHNGNGYASETCAGRCGGGSSSGSSPSPPPSPRRKTTQCRRRMRPVKDLAETRRLAAGIMARRSLRYFFLLPVVYIFGLLMCVGPFPFPLFSHAPLPGSRYRSHEVFHKLWHDIESDNSSAIQVSDRTSVMHSKQCVYT